MFLRLLEKIRTYNSFGKRVKDYKDKIHEIN